MSITKLRQQIDLLDQNLLKLLNDRLRLAAQIGKQKQRQGRSVFAPDREEQLLSSLQAANRGPITEQGLRAVYREIISNSRSRQGNLSIGYLATDSVSFWVARSLFGASDRYVVQKKGALGFQELRRQSIDLLVVPAKSLLETNLLKLSDFSLYSRVTVKSESKQTENYWVFCRHELEADCYDGALIRFPAKEGRQLWLMASHQAKRLGLQIRAFHDWTDTSKRWLWVEVEGKFKKSMVEEWRKSVQTYRMTVCLLGCFCRREF